jgi:copper(I)-binding protein
MYDKTGSPKASAPSTPLAWLAGVAALALLTTVVAAAPNAPALFIVNQPWVKPGMHATEAYMVLTSTEEAKLIGARSPIAARLGLRGPGIHGRTPPALALPAGSAVALRPGGNRIAVAGLAHALRLGQRFPLTLLVETATGVQQEVGVDAEVRVESPLDAERHHHH